MTPPILGTRSAGRGETVSAEEDVPDHCNMSIPQLAMECRMNFRRYCLSLNRPDVDIEFLQAILLVGDHGERERVRVGELGQP